MKHVKIENQIDTNNQNAELVTEVQNLIVKISSLLSNRSEPEYLVDLMSPEVTDRHGRAAVAKAANHFLQNMPQSIPELSEKFTKLLDEFNKRYFSDDPMLHGFKVEVLYEFDSDRSKRRVGEVIYLPVKSEGIMADQLLWEMSSVVDWLRNLDADTRENDLSFLEGAPVDFKPSMRHLSAEEFIAKATREPMTEEEHDAEMHRECAARQVGGAELN